KCPRDFSLALGTWFPTLGDCPTDREREYSDGSGAHRSLLPNFFTGRAALLWIAERVSPRRCGEGRARQLDTQWRVKLI
ncbi:hypothetical protein ABTE31_21540, partial [Acinetobacter baumannii]